MPMMLAITEDEAKELYMLLSHQYLNPNTYGHIGRLVMRLDAFLRWAPIPREPR